MDWSDVCGGVDVGRLIHSVKDSAWSLPDGRRIMLNLFKDLLRMFLRSLKD